MSTVLFQLKHELEILDAIMVESEQRFVNLLNKVHPSQYKSACNLLHYLAIRNRDIRELQDTLHEYGLSSLASFESHIRSQLLAILKHLNPNYAQEAGVTYRSSKELMKQKAVSLFGHDSKTGISGIMVTFDSSYANDYPSVKNLLQSGMTIARINCSHDDERTWLRICPALRSGLSYPKKRKRSHS